MPLLLPPYALRGMWVGLSVSETPDLARLGFLETHFRVAVAELTRAIAISGGGLIYGGRLDPANYTAFMVSELQRYSRRDRPLLLCVPWHEHRRTPLAELLAFQRELGLTGRVVCLSVEGREIAADEGRGEEPVQVVDPVVRRRALTGLRHYMRDRQNGRVLIGGRRAGFDGHIPGLMEEALVALHAGQPVYLAGGFGGITNDIARALGVNDGSWFPLAQADGSEEPGLMTGRRLLREVAAGPHWTGLNNGLSTQENQRLAVTHRPWEIAALVSLGLGRLGRGG